MQQFTTKVLVLLATCILLPPLFVNGLKAFHPTVRHNAEQKVIRGLLVTRQGTYCQGVSGPFIICETVYCCAEGWNCCISSSFFQVRSLKLKKFRRWWLLQPNVSCFFSVFRFFYNYVYCFKGEMLFRKQWEHWMLSRWSSL